MAAIELMVAELAPPDPELPDPEPPDPELPDPELPDPELPEPAPFPDPDGFWPNPPELPGISGVAE